MRKIQRLIFAAFWLLGGCCMFSQQVGLEKETISGVQPIADGRVHPEMVPDDAALRVLFIAVAEPEGATPDHIQRLRNKVSRMHLNEQDMQIFIRSMASFSSGRAIHEAALKNLQTQAATAGPAPAIAANIVAEQNAITVLATTTYGTLLTALCNDGAAKLRAHLTYVKTRIRIIPPPPMGHH